MDEKVKSAVAARGPGGVFTSSQIARQLRELEDDIIPVLDEMVEAGWLTRTTTSVEWTVGESNTPPVRVILYRNALSQHAI